MAVKQEVVAVTRWDEGMQDVRNAITVKEVLPSVEEAEAEVIRLNALNSGKGCLYFWQRTRFFPAGRGAEGSSGSGGEDVEKVVP